MKEQSLDRILAKAENIVFFGGAGVSTESGIPDFRSTDGLYHQTYRYPPERILSSDFFYSHTQEFYDFYRDKMVYPNVRPNAAHRALVKLEEMGKLRAVVTQNIDGLHQAAGCLTVLELHGSIHRNYCVRCKAPYPLSAITQGEGIPTCRCGGVIRPDVVLYGEGLDSDTMGQAEGYIRRAEVLLVGGTSLGVYPAAGLVEAYSGKHLVLINQSPTPMDARADLLISDSIGKVLGAAVEALL